MNEKANKNINNNGNTYEYKSIKTKNKAINNESKVLFEGKNNKVIQEDENGLRKTKNNKSVLIIKGDNNEIKSINKNFKDESENSRDTVVIIGNSNTIVHQESNFTNRIKNSNSTTVIVDNELYRVTQSNYNARHTDSIVANSKTVEINENIYYLFQTFDYYQKLATHGDNQSQLYLALVYFYGFDVAKNCDSSMVWFTKSAENGNSVSQSFLGDCYKNGVCLKRDIEKAILWYKKSAIIGDIHAKNELLSRNIKWEE